MGARQLAPLQRVLDGLAAAEVHGNLQVGDQHELVLRLLAFYCAPSRAMPQNTRQKRGKMLSRTAFGSPLINKQ
jgi:hypothetical protein